MNDRNETDMNPLPKSPFPSYLAVFLDNPVRRIFINRKRYLTDMGVKCGDTVFEAGCGPGFFTEAISEIVGENGRVYAQDVEQRMVEIVKDKLPRFRYKNVYPLLCSSTDTGLDHGSCDMIFLANVIEEIFKETLLEESVREFVRILKKGGTVVIKEHRAEGTKYMVQTAVNLFVREGLVKEFEKTTPLSFNLRLRKA